MKKKDVVMYLGGGDQAIAAERLGYKSRQVVYNWKSKLSSTLMEAIFLRMRANKIRIPPNWLADNVRI